MPLKGSPEWPVLAPDATLLSPPRVSAKRLVVFMACRERVRFSEDDLQGIVDAYVSICTKAGLDPLLVVSQLLLDTEDLTSAPSRPPGLDSVGVFRAPPTPHMSKGNVLPASSWAALARVHAGLLLAYALPAGAENAVQRALIEEAEEGRRLPRELRGSGPTLDELESAWGADSGYANRIRDIADTIMQPQW